MKVTKIIARVVASVMLVQVLSMQVFALNAQQVESIVSLNEQNQLVCDQHPDILQYIHIGQATDPSQVLVLKIPTVTAGYERTCYINNSDISAVEQILTQADQSVVEGGGQKTDAQNVLSEIADQNHLAPNYTDAAAVLAPVVPYINIVIGIITTVVVLAMQILTAFDLCYIAIPAFRNFMSDKAAEGNSAVAKKDGNGGIKLRFISDEAQYAVEQAANNQGSSPWGTYFKSRVLSYIFLAVAMVILLTGNVTLITDLVVKLVSGLMNVLQGLV